MGDLTKHFSRHEFACKCGCGFDTVDLETLQLLENIRDHFQERIIVHSGCRCAAHNAEVGGAQHSQHLRARAADIVVARVTPADVHSVASALLNGGGGLGSYSTFTHVDTRTNGPARWNG